MPKQYTFKTTRDTEWLEHILDTASPQDRSKMIRECIIKGLGKINTQKTNITQKTDVSPTPKVTQKTDVPPAMEIVEDNTSIDLDAQLDNLGGIFK